MNEQFVDEVEWPAETDPDTMSDLGTIGDYQVPRGDAGEDAGDEEWA